LNPYIGDMKNLNKAVAVFILMMTVSVSWVSAQDSNQDFPEIFTASDTMTMQGFEVKSTTATLHKVLGYTTIATGLLTGVLNPGVVGEGVHGTLGYTSAALAAATMGFGYLAHRNDIDMSSGMNSNNVHMVLGIAGGTMMIIAPFIAPGGAHKVVGELGALTMAVSVVGKIVY